MGRNFSVRKPLRGPHDIFLTNLKSEGKSHSRNKTSSSRSKTSSSWPRIKGYASSPQPQLIILRLFNTFSMKARALSGSILVSENLHEADFRQILHMLRMHPFPKPFDKDTTRKSYHCRTQGHRV